MCVTMCVFGSDGEKGGHIEKKCIWQYTHLL